jgi:hypothetical protein
MEELFNKWLESKDTTENVINHLKGQKFFHLDFLKYVAEQCNIPVVGLSTFERTWKNARLDPPKEGGRYWCLIEEQNDLGKSRFQWNCGYHEVEKRWSDNRENYNVIYWTELAPMPFGYWW